MLVEKIKKGKVGGKDGTTIWPKIAVNCGGEPPYQAVSRCVITVCRCCCSSTSTPQFLSQSMLCIWMSHVISCYKPSLNLVLFSVFYMQIIINKQEKKLIYDFKNIFLTKVVVCDVYQDGRQVCVLIYFYKSEMTRAIDSKQRSLLQNQHQW